MCFSPQRVGILLLASSKNLGMFTGKKIGLFTGSQGGQISLTPCQEVSFEFKRLSDRIFLHTVKIPNIRTPKKFAVITLKFE